MGCGLTQTFIIIIIMMDTVTMMNIAYFLLKTAQIYSRMSNNVLSSVNTFQDYLREQPDNARSFDLVAQATHFLGLYYTNVKDDDVAIVTGIFDALLEIVSVSWCGKNQTITVSGISNEKNVYLSRKYKQLQITLYKITVDIMNT